MTLKTKINETKLDLMGREIEKLIKRFPPENDAEATAMLAKFLGAAAALATAIHGLEVLDAAGRAHHPRALRCAERGDRDGDGEAAAMSFFKFPWSKPAKNEPATKLPPLADPPPEVLEAVKAAIAAAGLDPVQFQIVSLGKVKLPPCQCKRCRRAANYQWN